MDPKSHWDRVYQTKRSDEVSWFRRHLDISLDLIRRAAPARDAAIIDVGGGESTLVDDLIADGYRSVDVLDISPVALEVARQRLGADAHKVRWICGDVTTYPLSPHCYDVWHDRAVFHFLIAPAVRAAYVRQVAHAVRIGGHVIVATFGPEGPLHCSGLDVIRYDPDALHTEFGPAFRLVEHLTEQHQTQAGAIQQFVYCHCSVAKAPQ